MSGSTTARTRSGAAARSCRWSRDGAAEAALKRFRALARVWGGRAGSRRTVPDLSPDVLEHARVGESARALQHGHEVVAARRELAIHERAHTVRSHVGRSPDRVAHQVRGFLAVK